MAQCAEFPNGKLTLRLIRVLICDITGQSSEDVSQDDRGLLRGVVASVMSDIKSTSSTPSRRSKEVAAQLHIDLEIAELNQQIEMIDRAAQVEEELREAEMQLQGSPSSMSSSQGDPSDGYLIVDNFDSYDAVEDSA